MDRRASRRRPCRPRPAGSPGSSSSHPAGPDEPPRTGHRYRSVVATDLGLVANAAERHADELRFSDRAIDSPIDVLPVPGGPTRVRIAPGASTSIPRSSRSLRTAMYSTMRSLTSSSPAWSASSTSRLSFGSSRSSERTPHGRQQPVDVARIVATRVSSHPCARTGKARGPPARARGRASRTLRSSSGTPRRRTSRPHRAPSGSSRAACAGCIRAVVLHARVDVVPDAPADLHQRQPFALQVERKIESIRHVDRLEHLHLLLEGEIG